MGNSNCMAIKHYDTLMTLRRHSSEYQATCTRKILPMYLYMCWKKKLLSIVYRLRFAFLVDAWMIVVCNICECYISFAQITFYVPVFCFVANDILHNTW
jgi:hypothetical protein